MAAPYLDHPRPIAFAHRGGAGHNPENSLAAFEHAARLGQEGLRISGKNELLGELRATHDVAELPPFDLGIIAVKATDLDHGAPPE